MIKKEKPPGKNKPRQPSRMPENSTLYEKIVPTLLIIMAVVTVGLILFAFGVLVGLVSF